MADRAEATRRAQHGDARPNDTFLADVIRGLGRERKTLDPKYFYDEAGSRLFQRITELPEYTITRTETAMMEDLAGEFESLLGHVETIVEFGSGSGRRTDLLLEALPRARRYAPIDVSPTLLDSTAKVIERAHPHIHVLGIRADFTERFDLPGPSGRGILGYFPGSTIGNFLPVNASRFLVNARRTLGPGAHMLVGVDLVKPLAQLEAAYDDDLGVTAAFNMNLLQRINRELDADFDLAQFAHQAFYNEPCHRVEMHLVSLAEQAVTVGQGRKEAARFAFRAGETIHTENSHKYSVDSFSELARQSGWQCGACWTDPQRLFSLHLLTNSSD